MFLTTFVLIVASCSMGLADRSSEYIRKHRDFSESYNVKTCLFVWTYIYYETWTTEWLSKFLWYMDRTLIQSIDRQCPSETECPHVADYMLIFDLQGRPEFDFMVREYFDQVKNAVVFEDWTSLKSSIDALITNGRCHWISHIWIDADDILMDGYFQYVSRIPQQLMSTRTAHGGTWRGAIFVPRAMPRLIIGNNRCVHGKFQNYSSKYPFYSGLSAGRGFILRRWVWHKLDVDKLENWLHVHFAGKVRDWLMHGLGYAEYSTKVCTHGYFHWRNNSYQRPYEESDAAISRMLLIDVTMDWKTSGILIQSPFSAHFPWADYGNLPICNDEQMSIIQDVFPQDIQYLLVDKNLNISFAEACKNNFRLRYDMYGLHNGEMCRDV